MNKVAKRKRVPVHGVLLLDKPAGMSSTQALAKVKWLLNAEKAGHTGTLDPFATGLLPLCFGEATKFAQDLLEADKTYEATVHLGVTTTTGDTEGEIVDTRPVHVSEAQIESVLAQFRGPIKQVPPMYSALKRDGKPLYEYARKGLTLERDARDVVIHELVLQAFTPPELKIHVRCSKGTYIRVLGEDIGNRIGCGAHLTALRRTGAGGLSIADATSVEAFEMLPASERPCALLPVDVLLTSLRSLHLPEALAARFMHGQRLSLTNQQEIIASLPASGRIKVLKMDGTLLGLAFLSEQGVLAPERLISSIDSPRQIRS